MTQTIEQLQAKNAELTALNDHQSMTLAMQEVAIHKLREQVDELTKAAACWEEQANMLQHQNDEAFAELRSEIDELTAEVERLKTVPMKYRRMRFNAELQDENHELHQQLASAELDNVRLREALENHAKEAEQTLAAIKESETI